MIKAIKNNALQDFPSEEKISEKFYNVSKYWIKFSDLFNNNLDKKINILDVKVDELDDDVELDDDDEELEEDEDLEEEIELEEDEYYEE